VSLVEVLVHPLMIRAVLVYVLFAPALLYLGHKLVDRVEGIPVSGWLAEHAALPLLRVLSMLVFLAVAYPVVFGLEGLSPLSELLFDAPRRVMTLVNLLFVMSVLLAALPLIGNIQAIVLPLQGMAACALLLSWDTGGRANLWPGWDVLGAAIVWAGTTYALGSWLLHRLGSYIDGHWQLTGTRTLLLDTLMLVFQLPAILVYSLSIGAQLTGS
jgi:hypothetical protein